MTKKKLVVVDADTLVFRSAAVSEERKVNVKHLPSGRERIYKNKTEFKSAMKEKNFEIKAEDFEYEDIQEEQPLEYCLHTIKMQAEAIIERFSGAEVLFCCGEKNNFRLQLPFPEQYKSNRLYTIRPVHLSAGKDFLINKYKAKSADGFEVDDLSIILAYDGKSKGRDVILCSPDKDSKQAVGLKLFDYTNPDKDIVEINDWHEIALNEKKEFKSYGVPFLAYQMVRGDLSDHVLPYKLAGVKFGDSGAYKLFKDCSSSKDCLEKVVEQYKSWYPNPITYTAWDTKEYTKDYKELLQLFFSGVYMLRSYDDRTTAEEFFAKYGVEL